MMRLNLARRRLMAAAGAALLCPVNAGGNTSRPKRIVWDGSPARRHEVVRGWFAARGLVDGRNCTIDFTDTPKDFRDIPAHYERLVASRPEVLVLVGAWAGFLRRLRRPNGVPIVFVGPKDPVRYGLVDSLRRPGGNMTGATLDDHEMMFYMWQLLKEIAPGMTRGGFLQDQGKITRGEQFAKGLDPIAWQAEYDSYLEARRVIESRLRIQTVEVRMQGNATAKEIAELVRKSGAQALQVVIIPATEAVIEALKATRVPAVGITFGDVRRGLLMGVGWNGEEGPKYAVEAVDRILKGESPATIPVYRVRTWEFAINKTTARAMGMDIPPSLITRALQIVE